MKDSIASLAAPYCRGRGLALGSCRAPTSVLPAMDPSLFGDEVLDFVFADGLDVADYWRTIKPGGCLVLALASSESALDATRELSCTVVEDDEIDGVRFQVFRKHATAARAWVYAPLRTGPRDCLVIRGGAHGDALMASSVFPALRAAGWRLTLLTHQAGERALRHDPNLERILVTGSKSMRPEQQVVFWDVWGKRFAKVVNLTASVEGRFLQRPSDHAFYWPDDARRRAFGGSYLAFTHQVAGVAGPYRVAFYPSPEEWAWASTKVEKIGRFVMWSLHGSGQHKQYPYVHEAVCEVLERSSLNVVITGDASGVAIEHAVLDEVVKRFGANDRVFSMVGSHDVRQVYTLARYASVVVGPETGLLTAVSMERMRKVVLLSHGARSNLTDDWVNAIGIEPTAPCSPCHRLHFNTEHCPQDEALKAAVCAASIPASAVAGAVLEGIAERAAA